MSGKRGSYVHHYVHRNALAGRQNLVAYGTELALVIALVFVGAKLVGARLLR